MANFQIRPSSQSEVTVSVEWAASEGWNPSLDHLSAFHSADPEGFLMGYLDDKAVSSISVVLYGESSGFLGFYIVKSGLRRSGYGWRTWQTGLRHLSNQIIGLDGGPAHEANYRQCGFVLAGRNVRCTGKRGSISAIEMAGIQTVTPERIDHVIAYDSQFFLKNCEGFIRQWLLDADPGSRWAATYLDRYQVQALGTIRRRLSGYKVGQLVAHRQNVAQAVLKELCKSLPGSADVIVDVPEDNQAAVNMIRSFNFEPNLKTARISKGTKANLPIS